MSVVEKKSKDRSGPEPLQPFERSSDPKIISRDYVHSEGFLCTVELPHNNDGVDPSSGCTGSVTLILHQGSRGSATGRCDKCNKEVGTNTGKIQSGLGIL
ncbi:hypothetical protein CMO96_03265 [Candidatus Woesebacteria bacterium]|nr:hypothetical protein [Candidatus Woesebacteria bacterium]|tara:strand:- start:728 stop:1027 length:300 start_codon:yes stop_codon:yes gene_type:complete